MYLEGYVWEGLVEEHGSSDDPTVVSQEVRYEGTNKITETEQRVPLSLVPNEFASFGIQETTME